MLIPDFPFQQTLNRNKIDKMSFEAKVLYNFDAQDENELGIVEGETVTVIDTNVGQGWWMARSSDGRQGVVPESYLERLDTGAPPPPSSLERPGVTTHNNPLRQSTASAWSDEFDSEEEHRLALCFVLLLQTCYCVVQHYSL